ncbi:MAG: general secretion pathway protein GspL [Comamonadaceae bacterium]|nr:MAG: general secretion pathway protein GspL [Comamonadaceae bacterium]
MNTLAVLLPASRNTADHAYAVSADGASMASHGSAPPALLPKTARQQVVAVVPAALLSWHRVVLPRGAHKPDTPRLRAVLGGLLEERLLDDVDALHFAIEPHAKPGSPVWVCVCDRAWLQGSLKALEGAGHHVTHVVPELSPLPEGADGELPIPRVHVTGTPEQPRIQVASSQGVTGMPLAHAQIALAGLTTEQSSTIEVVAEPQVAGEAEKALGRTVSLMQAPERWLDAARSPWDLAQFDFANAGRDRAAARFSAALRDAWAGPRWRAARWGAGVLVAANLVGLNVWAVNEKSRIEARKAEVRNLLTLTFPDVKVVIDAPVQMSREVARLRQSSGNASNRDLEALLSAVGGALPAALATPAAQSSLALEFTAGELRLKGLRWEMASPDGNRWFEQLRTQGFEASRQGNDLVVRQGAAS